MHTEEYNFSQTEEAIQMLLYFTLGILLVISNCPVFVSIIAKRSLAKQYSLIAVLFAHCVLIGINCFVTVGYMISCLIIGEKEGISAVICLKRFSVWIDLYSVPMIAVCWLCLGVDRLLIVYFPLAYFRNQTLYTRIQLISIHLLTVIYLIIIVIITVHGDEHNATSHCREYEYLPEYLFVPVVLARLLPPSLFIVLTPIIFLRLKRYVKKVAAIENDQKFARFLKRQRTFTTGLFFCCICIFALFIVPNIIVLVLASTDYENIERISVYTTLLTYLNALPVAYIAFSTQPDICRECFKVMPFLSKVPLIKNFYKKENIAVAASIEKTDTSNGVKNLWICCYRS